ncbi:hypothetical protein D9756_003145 [Leucocoprinus leucothites]|uniref:Uncharacterized protein n=1 Tax=Leucocoprinus leucothites TaxID=201217 RepID=A0A8H5G679_9AGAR|nr:hypothetical protein D9756_003145 [Leucoagaricus leucothites]
MIPRSVNPHLVLEKTQTVSRKLLDEKEDENGYSQPDLGLMDEFNAVMKRTAPQFDVEERLKKRRKVTAQVDKAEGKEEEPILFRLISRGPPVPVSLKPKQERLMNVKEPEVEDNEAQAKERRERAFAVAVNADWVMEESLKPSRHPSTQSSVLHLKLPSPLTSNSTVMILCHNKPARNTRPPVQRKLGYPYDASAKPEPLQSSARVNPIIDLNRTLDDVNATKPKRRRRRKVKTIEHKFWRPDPNIKGKCMGYAMGFGLGGRR